MIEAYATGFPIRISSYTNRGAIGFTEPWAGAKGTTPATSASPGSTATPGTGTPGTGTPGTTGTSTPGAPPPPTGGIPIPGSAVSPSSRATR
jgi:filamentous hemagglutinin